MKNKKNGKKIERRFVSAKELRVKTVEGDEAKPAILEGYSAVFNMRSGNLGGFFETIEQGAFADALGRSDCRSLFNHNPDLILGRMSAGTLTLNEDKTGLFMANELPETRTAKDLIISINRGDITQQSFGFTVEKDHWGECKETGLAIRTIITIGELFDVSPVTFPAYPDTDIAKRSMDLFKESLGTQVTPFRRSKAEDEKKETYLKIMGYI
jgi:HK97 family phage prohead protease